MKEIKKYLKEITKVEENKNTLDLDEEKYKKDLLKLFKKLAEFGHVEIVPEVRYKKTKSKKFKVRTIPVSLIEYIGTIEFRKIYPYLGETQFDDRGNRFRFYKKNDKEFYVITLKIKETKEKDSTIESSYTDYKYDEILLRVFQTDHIDLYYFPKYSSNIEKASLKNFLSSLKETLKYTYEHLKPSNDSEESKRYVIEFMKVLNKAMESI